jgi:hypothetical protein
MPPKNQPMSSPSRRSQPKSPILTPNSTQGRSTSPNPRRDDDNDDNGDDQNDQNEEKKAETIADIISTPPSPTQHLNETNTFLAKLGLLSEDVALNGGLVFGSNAERDIYRIFDSNEPFGKSQILTHPLLKSKNHKTKLIEDGLENLIKKKIIISHDVGNGKHIFFLNQEFRPKITNDDQMIELKKRKIFLESEIQQKSVSMRMLQSETDELNKQPKTDELLMRVNQLRDESHQLHEKLLLLQAVSSDPEYIQSLKLTYTNTVFEWQRRKRLLLKFAEPYLEAEHDAKKQRTFRSFFKDLGCEDESVILGGEGVDDFILYGQKKHIFDAKGQVLAQGGVNLVQIPTNQSTWQSGVNGVNNGAKTTTGGKMGAKKGQNNQNEPRYLPGSSRAKVICEQLNKPQSPPKPGDPQKLSLAIKPLKFKPVDKKLFQFDEKKNKL